MQIRLADFDAKDFTALLELHLAEAHADDCSAALGKSELQSDQVSMFEARNEHGFLLGFAALKLLHSSHGEVKSVRTHPDHLRKGVSTYLMAHIETYARETGLSRLSLETHPTPAYAAAVKLYERLGYEFCGAFGDYEDSHESVFMTKELLPN